MYKIIIKYISYLQTIFVCIMYISYVCDMGIILYCYEHYRHIN